MATRFTVLVFAVLDPSAAQMCHRAHYYWVAGQKLKISSAIQPDTTEPVKIQFI
uniref:Uncharacterized protein n=1 Tax=Setaria viridis TaxID=4556 RepID=A0A4U6UUG8_SETVI|nr:hypothetical protein SEVIR_5G190150v2 [Setaria viridis]